MPNKPYLDIYSGLLLEDRTNVEVNTINYTSSDPISIINHDFKLKIDGQTLQLNAKGELACNFDEIGNDLTEKLNIDLTNITANGKDNIMTVVIENMNGEHEKYGIKGDYATEFGIVESPNGVLTFADLDITIANGLVLKCPGADDKITIEENIEYTVTSENDVDIFYANDEIIECGHVFYQELEPDNGIYNYIAWYKPSLKKWQFKSNETGNVWREAVACRLAHLTIEDGAITKADFVGTKVIDNLNLSPKNLLKGDLPEVEPLSDDDELPTVIAKINELIQVLKDRNIISQ